MKSFQIGTFRLLLREITVHALRQLLAEAHQFPSAEMSESAYDDSGDVLTVAVRPAGIADSAGAPSSPARDPRMAFFFSSLERSILEKLHGKGRLTAGRIAGLTGKLDLSKNEEAPTPFLRHVLKNLEDRGILESQTGPAGGYCIAAEFEILVPQLLADPGGA